MGFTLWFHQTWLAGKSRTQWRFRAREIIDKWSIFHHRRVNIQIKKTHEHPLYHFGNEHKIVKKEQHENPVWE